VRKAAPLAVVKTHSSLGSASSANVECVGRALYHWSSSFSNPGREGVLFATLLSPSRYDALYLLKD